MDAYPMTTEQYEALQRLYAAANHAAAVLDDWEQWRLEGITRDCEEVLLIAMGHPPRWVEAMDREGAGTSIRKLWRQGDLPSGCEGPLWRADILTVEELAKRSEGEIAALSGIGPQRLAGLARLLEEYGQGWAVAA